MDLRSVEQELYDLEYELLDAVRRNDLTFLERVVAPEYTLTATGSGRVSRAEWLAAVPTYEVRSFEFRDLSVQPYGEAAVVLADLQMRVSIDGSPTSGRFHFVDTWLRRDGEWQVVARGSVFTPAG